MIRMTDLAKLGLTTFSTPRCLPNGMFRIFRIIRIFSQSALMIFLFLDFSCIVMANSSSQPYW